MNIEFPDGSYQYTQAPCGAKTTLQVKLKNVKPGDYTVRVASSHVCCGTEGYTASAFIPDASTPAPATTPPPAPSGGGTTTTSPTADAAPQLTVKPSKASAKKLTKTHKYKITAEASGPLNAVTAKLLKGSKAIGTAKLSRLSGKATLVLKLGKKTKVKKGKYKVTVSGDRRPGPRRHHERQGQGGEVRGRTALGCRGDRRGGVGDGRARPPTRPRAPSPARSPTRRVDRHAGGGRR